MCELCVCGSGVIQHVTNTHGLNTTEIYSWSSATRPYIQASSLPLNPVTVGPQPAEQPLTLTGRLFSTDSCMSGAKPVYCCL